MGWKVLFKDGASKPEDPQPKKNILDPINVVTETNLFEKTPSNGHKRKPSKPVTFSTS